MTVAFDAVTNGTGGGFTHTPVGTPRGVLVTIRMSNATDQVTGVTYGGVTMNEVANSPLLAAGAEGGSCYAYFLGSSIPTGAQTCTVTVGAGTPRATCYTLTASADTEVVNTDTINVTGVGAADITDTLALSGRTCFVAEAIWSSAANVATVNPLSGWTQRQESDEGAEINCAYSYNTVASSDVTFGATLTGTEDLTVLAVAVSEVAGDDGVTGTVAQALPKLAQAAAGKETITGTVVQTLAKLAQAAAGDVVAEGVAGSVAQTLPKLAQEAEGDVVAPSITGTVAQTLPRLVQAAAGAVATAVTGVVDQILPALRQAIVGIVTNPAPPQGESRGGDALPRRIKRQKIEPRGRTLKDLFAPQPVRRTVTPPEPVENLSRESIAATPAAPDVSIEIFAPDVTPLIEGLKSLQLVRAEADLAQARQMAIEEDDAEVLAVAF